MARLDSPGLHGHIMKSSPTALLPHFSRDGMHGDPTVTATHSQLASPTQRSPNWRILWSSGHSRVTPKSSCCCRTRLWNSVRFLCDRCVSIGSHPRTKACPRCMRGMALASNRGCQARREVRGARGFGPHDRSELRELASQIHAQPANTLKQPTGSERGGPRPSGRPTCQPGNQHLHSPRQLPAAQSQRDRPRDRLSCADYTRASRFPRPLGTTRHSDSATANSLI